MSEREESSRTARDFLQRYPHVESVDLMIADLNGVLRGKRVPREGLERVLKEGLRFPGSIFSLDSTGTIVEGTGIVAEEGERDRFCRPVPGTLAAVPWSASEGEEPSQARRGQVLMTMEEADGQPFFADPRAVLARVGEAMSESGLTPVVAVELELYVLDPRESSSGFRAPGAGEAQVYSLARLERMGAVVDDIQRAARQQGLGADTAVAESGLGHLEINLRHQPDALRAADEALLFKRVARAVANRHGLIGTFMAKPFSDRASSGMHVHVSLVTSDGENAFASSPVPNAQLRRAIDGLGASMGDAMAIFAPNANSYRRYRPGAFIPRHVCWGDNNRTAALRIPPGTPDARRIEHRVAGADANPHLVVAAILAGMARGLGSDCPHVPEVRGNVETMEDGLSPLPTTWPAALAAFDGASDLRDRIGPRFSQLYGRVKHTERRRFDAHVTPLEREWYLETF